MITPIILVILAIYALYTIPKRLKSIDNSLKSIDNKLSQLIPQEEIKEEETIE